VYFAAKYVFEHTQQVRPVLEVVAHSVQTFLLERAIVAEEDVILSLYVVEIELSVHEVVEMSAFVSHDRTFHAEAVIVRLGAAVVDLVGGGMRRCQKRIRGKQLVYVADTGLGVSEHGSFCFVLSLCLRKHVHGCDRKILNMQVIVTS